MAWVKLKERSYQCTLCGRVLPLSDRQAAGKVHHNCQPLLTCPHRSPTPTSQVRCKLCGGNERIIPIYHCGHYGDTCALSRTTDGRRGEVRQCLECEHLPREQR